MTERQERLVRQWMLEYYEIANKYYKRIFPRAILRFSLNSELCGGVAISQINLIEMNKNLWKFGDDAVRELIGHEIAHLIVDKHYGKLDRSHSTEWGFVMGLFGLPPNRYHDLDLPLLPKTKSEIWFCSCRKHRISRSDVFAVDHLGEGITCACCGEAITRGEQ